MKNDLKFLASILDESNWPEDATHARLDADGEVCFMGGTTTYDFYPDDLDLAKQAFVPTRFHARRGEEYSSQDILNARAELHRKPNWDEKPEWADVWIESKSGNIKAEWYKDDGDRWVQEAGLFWPKVDDAKSRYTVHYPPENKSEWVPPVDTECEVEWNENVWRKCVVLLITDKSVFIRFVDEGTEHIIRRDQRCAFRPMHTEEDRVVEEMAESGAIGAFFGAGGGAISDAAFQALFKHLVRQGYRKQETK